MDESGNLNRLVSELGLDERAQLLEKLKSQASSQDTPMYEENASEPEIEIENRYNRLPWYYRIWYRIMGIFNNRTPLKMYEDSLMAALAHSIERKAPGFYSFSRDVLLPRFMEMLIYLRDASRFFYSALDASLNRDRGGLLVFLGSLEMPELHRRIAEETLPAAIVDKSSDISNAELRQKAHRVMEEIVSGVSGDQRGAMYLNARSLNCLKQLSAFPYDKMILAFNYDAAYQGNVCHAAAIRDQLCILNNILFSMREPPSMSLLESLFVFVLSEREREGPALNLQTEMRSLLTRAEASLEAVREFNRQVPLTRLLRCISRNMSVSPQNIGGGEDWFSSYKEHWKTLIDEKAFSFIRTRRQLEMQDSFRSFFKGKSIQMMANIESEDNPLGFPLKGAFALSFFQTFSSVVFGGELNETLRPIMLDGDFIRRENRTEYTEGYNHFVKLFEVIGRLDHDISPAGDYGKRYRQARDEMTALPVKRRKIQIILNEAAAIVERILEQSRTALNGLVNVLGGIAAKNDKYDTLSNISEMLKDPSFFDRVSVCISQLKLALTLLDDIDALDMEQR
jgi:hypothetical protein